DNFNLTHQAGPLLEETHYYPFGLTMGGISSKALNNTPENKFKYNNIELNEDLGLNTYDAFFRNLDPQIGRWWQIDPKVENMEAWSPFVSNFNSPFRFSDPLGDEGDDGFLQQAWQNFKDNLSSARDKIVGIVLQAGVNSRDNIENGRTLPQILARKFNENPLSAITGMGTLQGTKVIAAEVSLIANESKVAKEAGSSINNTEARGVDYSGLKSPKKVGPGLETTKAQRARILEANKQANGGVLKSDKSGKVLDAPTQSKKGVKANMNQAEVDHIKAKSKGGSNDNSNLQVLSKEENLKKRNQ
ncbi:RHS repeat-associated core domain-containing protein, partial [Sediminibacterium sp.]|uniref:RHS repeat-associated core domain-containing protein n=1 Tax=Sediminibacterium sp. TaxID=1917865 RepID=UPI0025DB94E9